MSETITSPPPAPTVKVDGAVENGQVAACCEMATCELPTLTEVFLGEVEALAAISYAIVPFP